jgi:hypothetical protein
LEDHIIPLILGGSKYLQYSKLPGLTKRRARIEIVGDHADLKKVADLITR